jgi:cytoskeletal protein CcmA (bactofilin family)
MDRVQEDSDLSVVGRGARVEGTLTSAGSVRIFGELTGDITVERDVFVAAGSVVKADITAGSINLGGRITGNLEAPGNVDLPAQSEVEGDVHAKSISVHGVVKGNIAAENRVELGSGAHVNGDVTCRSLVVAEGAFFRGRSKMDERGSS